MVSAYCTVRVPVEDDTGLEYPTWEAFRRSYTSIAWRFGHSPRRSPRLLDCCWWGMVFSGMRSGAAYFHVYSLGIFVDIRVRCTSIFFSRHSRPHAACVLRWAGGLVQCNTYACSFLVRWRPCFEFACHGTNCHKWTSGMAIWVELQELRDCLTNWSH